MFQSILTVCIVQRSEIELMPRRPNYEDWLISWILKDALPAELTTCC